jgi:hypothetical protein
LAALLSACAQERLRIAAGQRSLDGLVAGSKQLVSMCARLLQTLIGARVAIAASVTLGLIVQSMKKAHCDRLLFLFS